MPIACSVDLETMGKDPDGAIVQIGLAAFKDDADTFDTISSLSLNVNLASSVSLGMTLDPSTIDWWLIQDDVARKSILEQPRISIRQALRVMFNWYKEFKCEYLWSHTNFDATILVNAYRMAKMEMPWHYRDLRDLRTLQDEMPKDLVKGLHENRVTPKHLALHDAIHQAYIIWAIKEYQRIS